MTMKMMVFFSVILFTLTLPEGLATYSRVEKCITTISSKYPTESQGCSKVLDSSLQNIRKANVCSELYNLYDGICTYNASFGALDLPESQNVSKTNCVVPCADVEVQYLSMISDNKDSCRTLCLKDHEAVAILVTYVQLKGFIAELKSKEEHTTATVTRSTSVSLPQLNSTKEELKSKEEHTNDTVTRSTSVPLPQLNSTKEELKSKEKQTNDTVTSSTSVPLRQLNSTKEELKSKDEHTDDTVTSSTSVPLPQLNSTKEDGEKEKTTTPAKATEPADNGDSTEDDVKKDDNAKTDDDKFDEAGETNVGHGAQPVSEDGPSKTGEKDETSKLDDTPSSYHFLLYFLAFIVLCVAAYIVFHNKHKIIAFIIEGKQGRRGGRPSTKQYTPLKSKVEDVMPFVEKSTTQSNYIY